MEVIRTIIGGFVGLLVGVTLIAPIAVATYTASQDGNLSAAAKTLVSLVATMFVIAIMMVAVNMI
jgi:hypothetical protein